MVWCEFGLFGSGRGSSGFGCVRSKVGSDTGFNSVKVLGRERGREGGRGVLGGRYVLYISFLAVVV